MAKKDKQSWEPEQQFDLAATLEELINEPPFKEVAGSSGESHTEGARIPMWLHRRVMKLKELPGSPYELSSDVVRDALYIGLRVLNMRYKVNPDWDVESKMASIVDSVGASRRLKKQIKELEDGLDDLCKDGDIGYAAEKLAKYVYAAGELEPSWYKKKLFQILKSSDTVREVAKKADPNVWEVIEREALNGNT